MFIKTVSGGRCPFPEGIVVSEKPLEVPNSIFLQRRLLDGSVVLTTKSKSDTSSVVPSKLLPDTPNAKPKKEGK